MQIKLHILLQSGHKMCILHYLLTKTDKKSLLQVEEVWRLESLCDRLEGKGEE